MNFNIRTGPKVCVANIGSAQDDIAEVRWSRCREDGVTFAWDMFKELDSGRGRKKYSRSAEDGGNIDRDEAKYRPKAKPARWGFRVEARLIPDDEENQDEEEYSYRGGHDKSPDYWHGARPKGTRPPQQPYHHTHWDEEDEDDEEPHPPPKRPSHHMEWKPEENDEHDEGDDDAHGSGRYD